MCHVFSVFSDCCVLTDWIMIITIIKLVLNLYWPLLDSQHEEKVCFLPQSTQEFLVLIWLIFIKRKVESTWEPPSSFQTMFCHLRPLDWVSQPLGITTGHENENQISTLTTRMNRSKDYFPLSFYCNPHYKSLWPNY